MRKFLNAGILACCLLVLPFISNAQFVTFDALGFMKMLGHKDFMAAYPMMDTSMQAKVTKPQLQQLWEQLEGMYGAWKDVKLVSTEQKGDKKVAILDNDFEKAVITMKVATSPTNTIVGFVVAGVKQKETQQVAAPAYVKEEEATIHTAEGDLKGTIAMPVNGFKGKVVLIIAGSGPTDRNGNSILGVSARSYQLLAYGLAEKGIASLRYDKRMVGASTGFTKLQSVTGIEDFAADAASCVAYLEADKRFTQVYLCGHSEGSLVSLLVLQKKKVAGYISLCGMGAALEKTLEDQLINNAGYKKEEVTPVIDALRKGAALPEMHNGMEKIFTNDVVYFLHSVFQYDPSKLMKTVKIPVLIVAGTRDIQIPVTDAELLKKAKPNAQMLVIENMNHTLKDAPADKAGNMATYKNADLPLNDKLVAGLAAFLDKN